MLSFGSNQKGILIIEILVAITIIGTALISLLGLATFSLRTQNLIEKTDIANNLAKEEIEAVRNFRDGTNWDIDGIGTLISGIAYYAQRSIDSPPKWTLVLGEETIDIFKRKVVFSDVMRDVNDNIVESGGVNDPETKKLTVTVSWEQKSVEIITYLTKWKN